uniref:D7 short form salivary protein n=1 Tax=Anopheles dirus TaxID=7168 RepID=A0A1Y9H241_9DIPT
MLSKLILNVGLIWCLVSVGQAREEETVEECEKTMPASLKNRLCEVRKYTTVQGGDMDKHMQCVLEVVGFVEDNGDVNFQELLGVLKMVDPNLDHAVNIKECVGKATQVAASKKANTFYTCFLSTSSSSAFKSAVDYAELIRAEKLTDEEPFNAELVAALIAEIDDGLCK